MATLREKVFGKQTYYYLVHSTRKNGRVYKLEKYIGKKVPQNIENLKKTFISEIYEDKWYPLFEIIKKNQLL